MYVCETHTITTAHSTALPYIPYAHMYNMHPDTLMYLNMNLNLEPDFGPAQASLVYQTSSIYDSIVLYSKFTLRYIRVRYIWYTRIYRIISYRIRLQYIIVRVYEIAVQQSNIPVHSRKPKPQYFNFSSCQHQHYEQTTRRLATGYRQCYSAMRINICQKSLDHSQTRTTRSIHGI